MALARQMPPGFEPSYFKTPQHTHTHESESQGAAIEGITKESVEDSSQVRKAAMWSRAGGGEGRATASRNWKLDERQRDTERFWVPTGLVKWKSSLRQEQPHKSSLWKCEHI